MKRAVYAGSFDPITNGHIWMVEQGARLFDELIVAIGTNPEKTSTFSVEERLQMVTEVIRRFPQVHVDRFENQFLVHYAHSVGAQYILRGIRNEGDYEYERGIRHINSDLRPEIVTIFLIPPRPITEVSSSLVKGLIGPAGWEQVVQQYVPDPVFRFLLQKFSPGRASRSRNSGAINDQKNKPYSRR